MPNASSQEPNATKSQSDTEATYYDRYERVSENLTFVWNIEIIKVVPERQLGIFQTQQQVYRLPTPNYEPNVIVREDSITITGSKGTCTIKRTPFVTQFESTKQIADLDDPTGIAQDDIWQKFTYCGWGAFDCCATPPISTAQTVMSTTNLPMANSSPAG